MTVKDLVLIIITMIFSGAVTSEMIERHKEKTEPKEHELLCIKAHEVKTRHNVVLECIEVNN